MPSSFDIVTESPATVEQIHAAYSRKDYWLARIEPGAALTTLDSLIVDDDGTVKTTVASPSTWSSTTTWPRSQTHSHRTENDAQ